jgi:hypothetical protein
MLALSCLFYKLILTDELVLNYSFIIHALNFFSDKQRK